MSGKEESAIFKWDVRSSVLAVGGEFPLSPAFLFTASNKNEVDGIIGTSFCSSDPFGHRYLHFTLYGVGPWKHELINAELTISVSGQAIARQSKMCDDPRNLFFEKVECFPSLPSDETILTIQLEFTELNEKKIKESICESLHPVKESKVDSIYEKLLFDESINDIKLILDEKQYPAHKVVLAANSPVFHRMFSHQMKETLSKEVEIKDMHPEVLEELLKYMYTKKVDKFENLAGELLIAANRYEMEVFKLICEKELIKGLNVENVLQFITLADRHNAVNLKKHGFSIVMTNFAQVVEKGEFKDFIKSHPSVLLDLTQEMAAKCDIKIKK